MKSAAVVDCVEVFARRCEGVSCGRRVYSGQLVILLLLLLIPTSYLQAQDVWLQNHFAPNSGCNLTATQPVNVLINNNSATVMAANTITVSFKVDNGPVTNELLSVNLFPGASWNYTFTSQANLSACGPHTMKVWVARVGDANQLNDTLTWAVQNDCTIIPGSVTTDITVCEGANSGTLNLAGWTNGTINDWQYSDNGGTNWYGIGANGTSHNYSNLTTTTMYRVIEEGGYCPDDTSGIATVTIQAPPVAGTVDADMTLCEDAGNGNLSIVGAVGSVNFWEYSDDNGSNWYPIANTTTSHAFSGLTADQWFRAQIEGGVCPDVWTDTAVVTIDALSVPGTMMSDETICTGSSVNLSLTGNNGVINSWEYSEDMIGWTTIANTTGTYTTPNLTQTTYYRANVQNGVCAEDQSTMVIVTVVPEPVGGVLNTNLSVCKAVATGTLTLNGYSGTILDWEASLDHGVSWVSLGSSANTYNYTGLTDTTLYRVIVDGGACGTTYSDTAYINVIEDSYAGILAIDTAICEGGFADLTLTGEVGTSILWESSTNMTTWSPFAANQTVLTVSPITTTYYRVTVQNLSCPTDIGNSVTVIVYPLPVVDAGPDLQINEGDTVQLNGTGGALGIWTPPFNMSDQNIPDPDCWPNVTTTYTYSVISLDGCLSEDDVTITVIPIKIPTYDIKNVLTVNGDGYNDFWIIEGVEDFAFTEVEVFNIYGKEVYSNSDYRNEWDGTYKGKNLPDGTYYYRVFIDGTEFKGNLTILGNE